MLTDLVGAASLIPCGYCPFAAIITLRSQHSACLSPQNNFGCAMKELRSEDNKSSCAGASFEGARANLKWFCSKSRSPGLLSR